jgi:hypothetical protein
MPRWTKKPRYVKKERKIEGDLPIFQIIHAKIQAEQDLSPVQGSG